MTDGLAEDPAEVISESEPDRLSAFLTEAREDAQRGLPKSVKIRRLMKMVGAARRGVQVVDRVQAALTEHGLITDPPFTSGWIDNYVVIRLADSGATSPTTPAADEEASQEDPGHVGLTVQSLRSASGGVVSVERTHSLERARSLMLAEDYSQLAVMSGPRKLVGAVSWENMAKAALRDPAFTLADATVRTTPVRPTDDLIALIPRIISEGFVFVAGPDEQLTGIVTTADLGEQFAILANPFFLIGEIERRLRLILTRAGFGPTEFRALVDPSDGARMAESPKDLTLGEVQRLLERPDNWARLSWPLDRATFIERLDAVREIRNDVMHFSPDPLLDEQLDTLNKFSAWLRVMEPKT